MGYADDCNIYVASERAGKRVMQSVSRFIRRRLKLKVNELKSAVARPQERKLLGFSFTGRAKRRIAPKALLCGKRRVRELTRRTRGISLEQMTRELASYLCGRKSYFGFCETPSVLHRLDQWIRRRLRSVIWKQGNDEAHGTWRIALPSASRSPPLTSTRWTSTPVRELAQLLRTAVCGPACTVVWQGRTGDRPPYADLHRNIAV